MEYADLAPAVAKPAYPENLASLDVVASNDSQASLADGDCAE